jgi:putative ABC transport system permease protein
MKNWLRNFAYRIDINAGVFLTASILVLVIALAAVSYQSLRAAFANPVETIRYE